MKKLGRDKSLGHKLMTDWITRTYAVKVKTLKMAIMIAWLKPRLFFYMCQHHSQIKRGWASAAWLQLSSCHFWALPPQMHNHWLFLGIGNIWILLLCARLFLMVCLSLCHYVLLCLTASWLVFPQTVLLIELSLAPDQGVSSRMVKIVQRQRSQSCILHMDKLIAML